MTATTDLSTDREERLAVVVLEYLKSEENGQPLSPERVVECHPDLADDLRAFFQDRHRVASIFGTFERQYHADDITLPFRLGDYELLERIGGNMGVVFRARQISLPREVAVKVLFRARAEDRRRFRSEAEAMAALRDPHVVRILEVGKDDLRPHFSMEWYAGGTLEAKVQRGGVEPDEAARLVADIARGVHFAHRRGLLHRDLKPANILLDEAGRVCVADFGLAVRLDDDETSGGIAGTPAYMAPEQLTGDVTTVTDVHGIGAILYALLTGHAPFAGQHLAEIIEHVRAHCLRPLSAYGRRIPPDLETICLKCLQRDPIERYATAAEVADELERYLRGDTPEACRIGWVGRMRRVLRSSHEAGELQPFGLGMIAHSAVALGSNVAAFVLMRERAAEAWIWAAVLASYVSWFTLLMLQRYASARPLNSAERLLWTIWVGHLLACIGALCAFRIAAGHDYVSGFANGYLAHAALNALLFFAIGSLFAEIGYAFSIAWVLTGVLMSLDLTWAPLEYAVVIAACSTISGLYLRWLHGPRTNRACTTAQSETQSYSAPRP